MAAARHHPLPLTIFRDVKPRRQNYDNVIDTWNSIADRLGQSGCSNSNIQDFKIMFAAGIYAASRDVLMNRADSRSLSEDAEKLESIKGRA